MDALEPIARHVGVDLSGGNIGMAQEHLDGPQVSTVVEQMRGKGMTKASSSPYLRPGGLCQPVLSAIK